MAIISHNNFLLRHEDRFWNIENEKNEKMKNHLEYDILYYKKKVVKI